jgi:oligopeptide/dipeptide ABC transporter ATP-binding protein
MYDVENVTPRYVHELSGGMAQRVAIAIALAPEPGLVIADEPTTGLDATLRIQLITLLATMVREKGLTLLLVTHDNAAARVLAEDVAVLYGGMIVESGPVETVLNPEVPIKHPYTRFLLDAERRLNAGDEMPRISRGQIPPMGCPYAPQCDKAMDRCTRERPPLSNVEVEEHRTACWGGGT